MDKSELIEAVTKETHLSKPIVEKVINSVLAFLRKNASHPEPFHTDPPETPQPEQNS